MLKRRSEIPSVPHQKLKNWFLERGYVRGQDSERYQREGYNAYKKGYEVRMYAKTQAELVFLQFLIRNAGFTPAKPYANHSGFVQPVYGKLAYEWFLSIKKEEI